MIDPDINEQMARFAPSQNPADPGFDAIERAVAGMSGVPMPKADPVDIDIDRAVLDKVFVSRWGRDPEVPFASMAPGELEQAYVTVDKQDVMLRDIPPARMTQIRTALERSGLPTDIRNIAEAWLRAGKPQ